MALRLTLAMSAIGASAMTVAMAAGKSTRRIGASRPQPTHSKTPSNPTGQKTSHANAPLLRYPAVHGNNVVFEAGGHLWTTTLGGGQAHQLTSDSGYDSEPHYSPNGQWIAFTGWYQGNTDVYVIPAAGGEIRRLTYHSINSPGDSGKLKISPDNRVVGWTPNGRSVVFLSRRDSFNPQIMHAYTVPLKGGLPHQLPLPWTGPLSFGPNDHTVAYNKLARVYRPFHRKHYYGGQAQDIWTYDFKTHKTRRITHWKGADVWPMWDGDHIYFMSDRGRNHVQNLWSYDQKNKQFKQLTHFETYDIDFPTLGGHQIALSDGGDLYVYDTQAHKLHRINVQVPLDGSRAQPHWVAAAGNVDSEGVAPNGKLAVFSARGALFTVPAKYGSTQMLTIDPGADQRDPTWSSDGKQIAYIGANGDQSEIYVRPAIGGQPKALTHTKDVSYQPPITWSPDSQSITYVDSTQTLWLENVKTGDRHKIAQDPSQITGAFDDVHWSPGSDWLAFSKTLKNRISGLFLYHVANHKLSQISQGQYNDSEPVFSHDDKYLFFTSSRLVNSTFSNFDMITAGLDSSGLYAATLSKNTTSPIAPRVRSATSGHDNSGDALSDSRGDSKDKSNEKASDDKSDAQSGKKKDDKSSEQKKTDKTAEKKHTQPVKIDVAGLMNRAVRLDVPGANISHIFEAKGVVYYTTEPNQTIDGPLVGEKPELRAYDLKKRKDHTLATGISDVELAADGSTLFYQDKGKWTTRPASFAKNVPDDAIEHMDLSNAKRWVQPRVEWATIYGEAMRDVRDYFLNPTLIHKIWPAIDGRYRRLLARAASRDDVNWLIANAIGTPGESHMYIKDGDLGHKAPEDKTADLGANFGLDKASGRYTLKRIYSGDNTIPDYQAPLAQPGLKVKQGDFVLAVNGQPLKAPMNPYSLLAGTVGTTISLKVADNASGKNAHTVHVDPIPNAEKLHLLAWIRHNRRQIAKMSDGKIGYVYLRDMEAEGMHEFVRQYYSQINKPGLIFDDRWNLGGFIDPLLFDRMDRELAAMFTNRHRWSDPTPSAPAGYMAALINRGSASDGDIFAYMFKKDKLGPTIGSRTWAGVRGYYGPFKLLDGGQLIVSDDGMYGLDSKWNIENIGVFPDIMVHDEPGQLNAGHDAQIEKAVSVLMNKIKAHPKAYPKPPAWMPAFPPQPNYPDCGSPKVGNGPCD